MELSPNAAGRTGLLMALITKMGYEVLSVVHLRWAISIALSP